MICNLIYVRINRNICGFHPYSMGSQGFFMVFLMGSPSDQAHKLPALMQAIAVMPVLEPWTREVRLLLGGCSAACQKCLMSYLEQ
jgi:hypothetical protein